MCGIFASVGKSDVSNILVEGLSDLEYRGYDSAGLCLDAQKQKEGFEILKASNSRYPVDVLKKNVNKLSNEYFSGIGHTRWATHGSVNNKNAHPHLSFSNNLSIVHNGIVENYNFLKKLLIRKGIDLKTETDSEVIGNLIDLQISCSEDIPSAIISIFKLIEGNNTIAVMHKNYPGKIFGYSTDDSGGLVVGTNNTNTFLSSDAYALENICDSIYSTKKHDLIVISKNSLEITDLNSQKVDPKKLSIENMDKEKSLVNYNLKTDFMIEKEIFEQKEILKNLIEKRIINYPKFTFPEIDKNLLLRTKKFIFTGMGSSYNSALFGSLLYEELIEMECKVEFSSELKSKKIINPENTILFAISQSGETADTLEAIRNCRAQGVNVISIIQEKNSKASNNSDSVILLNTGKEMSVAATKTFSSTLLLFNALALNHLNLLNGERDFLESMKNNYHTFSESILDIFTSFDNKFHNASQLMSDSNRVFFIGKNSNYPIAKEGSLKLQEIAQINSNAFTEGELKHGPNALLDRFASVVSIIGPEDDMKKSISSIREIISRGSKVIIITHVESSELNDLSDNVFVISKKDKYAFSILATIVLQKLAFFSCLNLGLDPDRPDNLAKTVTVE